MKTEIVYSVFWLSSQKDTPCGDRYYVLGDLMGSFDNEHAAISYVNHLNLDSQDYITILKVYKGIK